MIVAHSKFIKLKKKHSFSSRLQKPSQTCLLHPVNILLLTQNILWHLNVRQHLTDYTAAAVNVNCIPSIDQTLKKHSSLQNNQVLQQTSSGCVTGSCILDGLTHKKDTPSR